MRRLPSRKVWFITGASKRDIAPSDPLAPWGSPAASARAAAVIGGSIGIPSQM